MAGKGIEISAALNARKFQQGVSDVEGALEDVADSLDGVAKEADSAGRKMGDEIADGAKDATQSVDRLERSFKDMADASKRSSTTASNTLKSTTKDATVSASRDLGELKDEAKQNLAETLSSFDGSVESFVAMLQGTLGGVVSNVGVLGLALGAAGAAGIGLIVKAFEEGKISEQQFREQVAELAATLIDTGDDGAEAVRNISDRLKDLATSAEESKQNLAELRDDAASSASGFRKIADAYAGNTADLDNLISKEREHLEVLKLQKHNSGGWDIDYAAEIAHKIEGQKKIITGLEDAARVADEAEKSEAAWLASNGEYYAAKAEMIDSIQSELDESVSSWKDYVDAESNAIDPGAFIAGMAAKREAIANFNTNVQTISQQFGLTYAETQAILDQGLDFAPHLQSIIDSGMAEAYAGEVRASLSGGQSIIDGTPLSATITTKTDAQDAEKQLDNAATERTAPVKAAADTAAAAKTIDDVAAKPRTAKIVAAADTSTARQQLDRLTEKLTVTIQARVVDQRGVPVP